MTKYYQKNYPRPQFVRKNWENLNGIWKFWFDRKENEEIKEIRVPFTYETKASGIGDTTMHESVWYERTIHVEEGRKDKERLLLHFEGSDYRTEVWVNEQYLGDHVGGYERFSFDITKQVHAGENCIRVHVEDSFSMTQPRGKQRWQKENFGCWYVQTTGIWKTVWMEYVPKTYLESVKMTPDLKQGVLHVEMETACASTTQPAELEIMAAVSIHGIDINKIIFQVTDRYTKGTICLDIHDGREPWVIYRWSPQDPQLYDIEFTLLQNGKVIDTVGSYFGMREIEIRNQNILLNGLPLYQKLILDQGYWEESHLTPPSEEALIDDIDKIMAMGYNGLRKHQKIEDERFLYWCDVKGMLVWSEAPSAYYFSDLAVENFMKEWIAIVKQNYNHPSIITWTPFNESWGLSQIRTDRRQQHFTESVYNITKSIDPMRPVICNDGWEHTVSDVLTLHDYEASGEHLYRHYMDFKEEILNNTESHSGEKFAFAEGYGYRGQPIIISEYGGIAFTADESGWGYGDKVADEEEFLKRFEGVTQAIKNIPYVCGYCYTQVTDVQQEVNGLMDIRRNYKVLPEKIREINDSDRIPIK